MHVSNDTLAIVMAVILCAGIGAHHIAKFTVSIGDDIYRLMQKLDEARDARLEDLLIEQRRTNELLGRLAGPRG